MTRIYYKDDFITLYQGDVRDVLPTLEGSIAQTCVTSPPYFGLRDYGADGQIGLEPTPAEFVGEMVKVFDEVRRVLRPDGTAWCNLGDSYASNWPCNRRSVVGSGSLENGKRDARPPRLGGNLKDKDLMGIPWRVAFALQDAGWWLRQDIIWSKPNPMPESVTDRCTKAHEYIFLLANSAKYFYDARAIATPYQPKTYTTFGCTSNGNGDGSGLIKSENWARDIPERRPKNWKGSEFHTGKTAIHQLDRASTNRDRSLPRNRNGITGTLDELQTDDGAANKKSVWTVSTKPFKEAHFATFPMELIQPCILAGSRQGDTVLEPFAGAGTTLVLAKKLGRKAIGVELNEEYCEMIVRRIEKETAMPLFDQ